MIVNPLYVCMRVCHSLSVWLPLWLTDHCTHCGEHVTNKNAHVLTKNLGTKAWRKAWLHFFGHCQECQFLSTLSTLYKQLFISLPWSRVSYMTVCYISNYAQKTLCKNKGKGEKNKKWSMSACHLLTPLFSILQCLPQEIITGKYRSWQLAGL